MTALYNEIEPYPAAWLKNLIDEGHIAHGRVDTRSVEDLSPADMHGVTQFHAFAGIGVWGHALRLAGVPDDRPIWSGSAPCQPWSNAGSRKGAADARHLWPAWFRLIRECRPPVIVGEQTASRDGLYWLDLVQADLEGEGYSFGASDLCAAGVGAPHLRQRLWFVGFSREERRQPWRPSGVGRLASSHEDGRGVERAALVHAEGPPGNDAARRGAPSTSAVGNTHGSGARQYSGELHGDESEHAQRATDQRQPPQHPSAASPWADPEWIPCTDGVERPVERGTSPLVARHPTRVARVRAYGNAIVAPLAATFIRAALSANDELSR